jgi:tyrosyl-tRNA synthetase
MAKGVVDILRERGLIEAETSDQIAAIVEREKPVKIYCGVDPTANSLHLGHLVAFVGLSWFRRYGHIPVALVGGATGLIGDPSGKSVERNMLSNEELTANVQALTQSLQTLLSRSEGAHDVIMMNNRDWFEPMGCIEFLRDIGRHFRVGTMISRESVRARLSSEEGLSYTEFSYQLLQAYDFYHLFQKLGVTMQIGGSDQWGNITAGIDFVRRLTGKEVYGLTFPLLLRSDGKKFGKSESGAVWLSEARLSPYDFYQYLYRVSDEDVIRLLKALTFLDIDEIAAMERHMKGANYTPNTAQKLLADEVTRFVHGDEGLMRACRITEHAMPGKEKGKLSAEAICEMKGHVPTAVLSLQKVVDVRVCDVMTEAGFSASRAEARNLIKNGGVRIGDRKIDNELDVIHGGDLIEGQWIVFSLGKKNRAIIEIG